jgi:hypothetical protein
MNAETKEQSSQKMLNKRCLPAKKLMATVFWDRRGVPMVEFTQHGMAIMSEVYCETLKKSVGPFRMPTSGVMLLHDNARPRTAARTEHSWSISTRSCLTTLLMALILLWATTTCLPTWRTGWDHSTSAIMSWWKVSKCMWLSSQAAHFSDTGIQQLFSSGGDYTEK